MTVVLGSEPGAKKKPHAYGKQKHVPQRTCIVCKQVAPKRSLIRLVMAANGFIEIDRTGKKAGRGAYMCTSKDCWEKGIKEKKKLEHAFRSELSAESLKGLREYMKGLNEKREGVEGQ
jgi:hypothetical protein